MTMPSVETWVLLLTACIYAWSAWLNGRSRKDILATRVAAEKTEVNTNHMREQLVAATGKAAHAAGRNEMRQEAEATAAAVAARQA